MLINAGENCSNQAVGRSRAITEKGCTSANVSEYKFSRLYWIWDLRYICSTRGPLLTKSHCQLCIEWAREHQDRTIEKRKGVVLSNEFRFLILHIYGRVRGLRHPEKQLFPHVQQLRHWRRERLMPPNLKREVQKTDQEMNLPLVNTQPEEKFEIRAKIADNKSVRKYEDNEINATKEEKDCHGWLGCSPIFDDFFQHLWPYIGNNTANVVFQMIKRLWLIRIDQ
ncbi:hypothetical protein TNCV_1409981 [Trichonephila clavipes]|nr:hypothetical protein TNCV_1409981 [Trichonephila clavipes]